MINWVSHSLVQNFIQSQRCCIGYHGLTLDWPQGIRSSSLDDVHKTSFFALIDNRSFLYIDSGEIGRCEG